MSIQNKLFGMFDTTKQEEYIVKAHLLEAVEHIDRLIKSGKRVLVYCAAGMSRSVSAVIAYFIIKRGMSYDDSFNLVSSCRFICPNRLFVKVLSNLNHT